MVTSVEVSEEAGVRTLHFGSPWIQGAMRIARPYALELEYTRELMLPLLLRGGRSWPRRVLQVGLGAASITKFLYRNRPRAKLTVVEIEPKVVAVARQCFKLPDDPKRITIEIGDGVEYVAASEDEYDLVVVDGFDAKARTGKLESIEFYRNARRRLVEGGLVAANILSRPRGRQAAVTKLAEAFEGRTFLLPPCEGGNTIAIAATGGLVDRSAPELANAARELKREAGLNLLPTLARWRAVGADTTGAERLVL